MVRKRTVIHQRIAESMINVMGVMLASSVATMIKKPRAMKALGIIACCKGVCFVDRPSPFFIVPSLPLQVCF
ncbi:MAG: hypothetical protein M1344_02655 [Candidatus Thermoplasmatota archaeon]|nr:hypothetical protein [Candidatus Thermoplasmatota archaeon]